jgi:hypothetical protein
LASSSNLPALIAQCDKQTLCGQEHGVWMPVLECCSSLKNLLLSTLFSAIPIQKSNSFLLSPSQNILTEPFVNTTNQNTKTKLSTKKWGREIDF